MTLFERRTFSRSSDYGGRVLHGLEFRRCIFDNCSVSATRDVRQRSRVVAVRLEDVESRGCFVGCPEVHESEIVNLKTDRMLMCWGAVFRHVVFRGRIGSIMASPYVDPMRPESAEQRAADAANRAFYETVDWAIDIQRAEFVDADFRGVPADLVRRDPETQFIVRRERLLDGSWRRTVNDGTAAVLQAILQGGASSEILIAPKRAKDFRKILQDYSRLRAAGFAE